MSYFYDNRCKPGFLYDEALGTCDTAPDIAGVEHVEGVEKYCDDGMYSTGAIEWGQ